MTKRTVIVLCLAVLASGLNALGSSEKPMLVTIDPTQKDQTIEHFGASAAWWAQAVATWPEAPSQGIVDLLFDPVQGIGLNLVRYNLGGGKDGSGIADPWRSAVLPLTKSGSFDWSLDPAVTIVDKAVAKGARVLVFTNSPPGSLTVTGLPTGNKKETNLRPDARQAFAVFLADAVQSLATERHWPIVAVSPINEPQWDWQPAKGQEGSYYTPEDAHALLTAVAREWARRGLSPQISAIDSGEWKLGSNLKYLQEIWGDSELRKVLTHYAVHSYWSQYEDREGLAAYVAANLPGLVLWQTEWTEMKGGRDTGMDSAMVLAKTVQEDFAVGHAASWQYWIAVSKYDFRDGLVYVNEASQTFMPTKRLWALGNWSRFVKPGARRVAVTPGLSGSVGATAFENPDGSLVTVLVNETPVPVAIELHAPGARTVSRWETSATRDLELVYDGVPGRFEVPATSVTTVVVRR